MEDLFFIITERGEGIPSYIYPGRICYMKENRYLEEVSQESKVLPVKWLGSVVEYRVQVDSLHPVSKVEAALLQALDTDEERLDAFLNKAALEAAAGLKEGSSVFVEDMGKWHQGVVQYIGSRSRMLFPDCISGTFFRIKLQDGAREIWVPFSCVKPASETPVQAGDRVIFFPNNETQARRGMVMELKEIDGETLAFISTDKDEQGVKGGSVTVPLGFVLKEEFHPSDMGLMDTDAGTGPANSSSISLNSRVRVHLGKGSVYGTVRWIGNLPGSDGTRVGLELDTKSGVSDGQFKEVRYFTCPPKQGMFVKMSSCFPDTPYSGTGDTLISSIPKQTTQGRDADTESENVPPISSEDVKHLLVGRMKGIQGHCNSCYMDSALFSLFSCSSVLDSLLFKPADPKDQPIQRTLLLDIVNPLRRRGFVEAGSVMKLRKQLQERGYCPTFTTDEKDPEEFLSLIMNKILSLEPPIKLCSGNRVQSSYCYQIFLDEPHNLILPTVQQLIEQSFYSGHLKLAEVPSCLILQMPRFGKNFKMFPKIIPSLELDITGLLSEVPQQCLLCGGLASEECKECFKDSALSRNGFKYFCQTCSTQVHRHPSRRSHKPCPSFVPEGWSQAVAPPRDVMEMFAVLCIDTSHYVSFLKYGPNTTDWAFFDSMSDREGESDGYSLS
ncbi:ubiquitin carboxyl-terminal hydrolase CYLD isoform X2 [Clupea harengus]|uniref:Ubiquitin carboxyl-terminal hydrolase CYLD n=1 Tax=Clupea harengus TaxID=7950 RepID=A0A6P8G3U2_CLUHA|nr:ubiquitin carboxyl-terminal hydrolase CYLD isoform X2 [Clupea harengus]